MCVSAGRETYRSTQEVESDVSELLPELEGCATDSESCEWRGGGGGGRESTQRTGFRKQQQPKEEEEKKNAETKDATSSAPSLGLRLNNASSSSETTARKIDGASVRNGNSS